MFRAVRRSLLIPLLAAGLVAGCGTEPEPAGAPGAPPAPPSAPAPAAPAAPTDPAAPAGQRVELAYAGGEVAGGVQRVSVPLGSTVTLTVTGDAPDEVHVHGYDEYLDVAPGTEGTVTFQADIPGVFEVELHDSGLLLAQLQVS